VRRLLAQARVEQLDVHLQAAAVRSSAFLEQAGDARHELPREDRSWLPAAAGAGRRRRNRISVLSSPPKPSWIRLPTISGIFLLRRLLSAYSARFSLSAAKPTHSGGGQGGDFGEDVRILHQFDRRRRRLRAFLIFCAIDLRRPVVGDRGHGDEDVVLGDPRVTAACISQRAGHVDAADAASGRAG
jgi:hypothetical protein